MIFWGPCSLEWILNHWGQTTSILLSVFRFLSFYVLKIVFYLVILFKLYFKTERTSILVWRGNFLPVPEHCWAMNQFYICTATLVILFVFSSSVTPRMLTAASLYFPLWEENNLKFSESLHFYKNAVPCSLNVKSLIKSSLAKLIFLKSCI